MVRMGVSDEYMMEVARLDSGAAERIEYSVASAAVREPQQAGCFDGKTGIITVGRKGTAGSEHKDFRFHSAKLAKL